MKKFLKIHVGPQFGERPARSCREGSSSPKLGGSSGADALPWAVHVDSCPRREQRPWETLVFKEGCGDKAEVGLRRGLREGKQPGGMYDEEVLENTFLKTAQCTETQRRTQ